MPIVSALLVLAFATFDESYRAGLQALSQNRLAEAKVQLEAAASLDPGRSRVWVALARTYWKLGEPAKADEAAGRAERLAAGDAQVMQLLAMYHGDAANAYAAARQWALADAEFPAAIRLKPAEESYRFEYANSLLQRQQFERAVRVLEPAAKTFDKSPQLALALGVGYYGLRRFAESGAAFERTLALDPNLEQPYLFLGKMLDQLPSRVAEVARVAEAFESAHPDSYVGYLVHAKALMGSSSATELLKKAAALNPTLAEPHYELGVRAERDGRFAEAAAEFEKAAALDPGGAATHYHLARVYDRLDKSDAAARERELHKKLMNAAPDASKDASK